MHTHFWFAVARLNSFVMISPSTRSLLQQLGDPHTFTSSAQDWQVLKLTEVIKALRGVAWRE